MNFLVLSAFFSVLFLPATVLAGENRSFEFTAEFDPQTSSSILTLDLYFYPATEERLREVVRAFTSSRLQTKIAAELQKRRPEPDNKISSEYSRTPILTPGSESLRPTRFLYSARFGIPFYKKKTGLECIEGYVSPREWTQTCTAALNYENTQQFTDDAQQEIYFKIEDDAVHCHFVTTATAKEIEFNMLERAAIAILRIEKLSATQLTFKGFESSLDQSLTTQVYLQGNSTQAISDIVDAYYESGKKIVTQMMNHYPRDPTVLRSIDFNSEDR